MNHVRNGNVYVCTCMYTHTWKKEDVFVSYVSHRSNPHGEDEIMCKIAVESYHRPYSSTATWAKETGILQGVACISCEAYEFWELFKSPVDQSSFHSEDWSLAFVTIPHISTS